MLVHTVVRPDLIEPIGLPRLLDVLDYHSSVEDAAQTAARGGVGTLVLTHPRPGAPAGDRARMDRTGQRALRRHGRPGPRPPDARRGPGRLTPVSDVFREASAYYMVGRPPYSRQLLPVLRRELGLVRRRAPARCRVRPGCPHARAGPGVRRSPWASIPTPACSAEGAAASRGSGARGLRWVLEATAEGSGSSTSVRAGWSPSASPTTGRPGVPVLDAVHALLEPGGAVALVGHRVEGRPEPAGPGLPRIPEEEIMRRSCGSSSTTTPRCSSKVRRSTPHLHEADLGRRASASCRTVYAPGRSDVVRDVDSVVAGYYSTSYAAPRLLRRPPGVLRGRRAERCCSSARPTGLFWDWPGDTEIVLASA